MKLIKQTYSAFILLIIFTILTGLVYPLIVTGIAQLFFPWRANGSLITVNDKIVGSKLIGQSFTDIKYFNGRPSATMPYPYNAANSSGSNLGPANPIFLQTVRELVNQVKQTNPQNQQKIPIDLVTASGSGLDPEISPAAAFYQASRIAKARGLQVTEIMQLIQSHVEQPFLIFGEPRVNVLELNLALDGVTYGRTTTKSRTTSASSSGRRTATTAR